MSTPLALWATMCGAVGWGMSGTSAKNETIFTCWKEIAAYLGKGVRTVQRWEAKYGLPVRRPNEQSRSVFASREELDGWLRTSWSQRLGKLGISQLPNGAKTDKSGVEVHRELRGKQRELMSQMKRNLQILGDRCRALSFRTKHFRLGGGSVKPSAINPWPDNTAD